MESPEKLNKTIEELTDYIRNAARQVDDGMIAELSMLEGTVQTLCESVQKMDGESAQLLKPQMAQLITSLDELAGRLKDFKASQEQNMDTDGASDHG